MKDPQVTNYFKSKEEERDFYFQSGYRAGVKEERARILAIVEEIHNNLHEYLGKVTDPNVYNASKRAIDDYTRELKARIQEATDE